MSKGNCHRCSGAAAHYCGDCGVAMCPQHQRHRKVSLAVQGDGDTGSYGSYYVVYLCRGCHPMGRDGDPV